MAAPNKLVLPPPQLLICDETRYFLQTSPSGCALYPENAVSPLYQVREPVLLAQGIATSSQQIHLVILKANGELCYTLISGTGSQQTTTLAKLDVRASRYRRLYLFPLGKVVHIFYAYAHQAIPDLWHIEHRFWNGKTWRSVRLGEVVHPKEPLYHVSVDPQGNLHLLMMTYEGRSSILQSNRFHGIFHLWGTTIEAARIRTEVSDMTAIFTPDNIYHVFWLGKNTLGQYELGWAHKPGAQELASNWMLAPAAIKLFNGPCRGLGVLEVNGGLWLLANADQITLLLYQGDGWKPILTQQANLRPLQLNRKNNHSYYSTYWLEDDRETRFPAFNQHLGLVMPQKPAYMLQPSQMVLPNQTVSPPQAGLGFNQIPTQHPGSNPQQIFTQQGSNSQQVFNGLPSANPSLTNPNQNPNPNQFTNPNQLPNSNFPNPNFPNTNLYPNPNQFVNQSQFPNPYDYAASNQYANPNQITNPDQFTNPDFTNPGFPNPQKYANSNQSPHILSYPDPQQQQHSGTHFSCSTSGSLESLLDQQILNEPEIPVIEPGAGILPENSLEPELNTQGGKSINHKVTEINRNVLLPYTDQPVFASQPLPVLEAEQSPAGVPESMTTSSPEMTAPAPAPGQDQTQDPGPLNDYQPPELPTGEPQANQVNPKPKARKRIRKGSIPASRHIDADTKSEAALPVFASLLSPAPVTQIQETTYALTQQTKAEQGGIEQTFTPGEGYPLPQPVIQEQPAGIDPNSMNLVITDALAPVLNAIFNLENENRNLTQTLESVISTTIQTKTSLHRIEDQISEIKQEETTKKKGFWEKWFK